MLDNAITSSFSAETANALVASLAQIEPAAIAKKPKAQAATETKPAGDLVRYDADRPAEQRVVGIGHE